MIKETVIYGLVTNNEPDKYEIYFEDLDISKKYLIAIDRHANPLSISAQDIDSETDTDFEDYKEFYKHCLEREKETCNYVLEQAKEILEGKN